MTTVYEKARAFAVIAEHLPDKRRTKVAKHIAGLIDGKGRRPSAPGFPSVADEPAPPVDLSEHTETASFLVDHGYEGAELVKATGRLTTYLATHPNLTKEAAMRVWLGDERGRA